jgi:hypothetical protein
MSVAVASRKMSVNSRVEGDVVLNQQVGSSVNGQTALEQVVETAVRHSTLRLIACNVIMDRIARFETFLTHVRHFNSVESSMTGFHHHHVTSPVKVTLVSTRKAHSTGARMAGEVTYHPSLASTVPRITTLRVNIPTSARISILSLLFPCQTEPQ